MAKKEGNGKGKTGKKGAALIERLTLTFHRPLFTLSDYEAYHDTDLLRPYPTSRRSPPISYSLTFSPRFAVVVTHFSFFIPECAVRDQGRVWAGPSAASHGLPV